MYCIVIIIVGKNSCMNGNLLFCLMEMCCLVASMQQVLKLHAQNLA